MDHRARVGITHVFHSPAMVRIGFLAICVGLIFLAGCGPNMRDQARLKPIEPVVAGDTSSSARGLVPGTLPRDPVWDNEALSTGTAGGQVLTSFPVTVTRDLLVRGQQRFTIYCVPCHGAAGDGKGLVTSFGLKQPPSFHETRLVQSPVGYFFGVITNGRGAMYSYANRVSPEDRWAIIAYIRALQIQQEQQPQSGQQPSAQQPQASPLDVSPEAVQQRGAGK